MPTTMTTFEILLKSWPIIAGLLGSLLVGYAGYRLLHYRVSKIEERQDKFDSKFSGVYQRIDEVKDISSKIREHVARIDERTRKGGQDNG